MKKTKVYLDSYQDFESLFPSEYFELSLKKNEDNKWLIYYLDQNEKETEYGPYEEDAILPRISLAPFFFDEMIFIYHLIEHNNQLIRNLGVRLLKKIADL